MGSFPAHPLLYLESLVYLERKAMMGRLTPQGDDGPVDARVDKRTDWLVESSLRRQTLLSSLPTGARLSAPLFLSSIPLGTPW